MKGRGRINNAGSWLAVISVAIGLLLGITPGWAGGPVNAAIIMDYDTGGILIARNADTRTQPASLTKMMTLFLLFEALDSGKMGFDTNLRVSAAAAAKPATNLRLKAGNTITAKTAIRALIIQSANDVATVVAENVGGTEAKFVAAMNRKAKQLGMKHTNFRNPSGLPDPRQQTTARDMAILAAALIDRFPHHYHFFNERSFRFNGRNYIGHNRVLGQYRGADGLKTGYVRASGFNLASSATRNGRRLVGVVLGGASSSERDKRMMALLDQGFSQIGAGGPAVAVLDQDQQKPQSKTNKPASKPVSTIVLSTPGGGDVTIKETTIASADPLPSPATSDNVDEAAARELAVLLEAEADSVKKPTSTKTKGNPPINGSWAIQVGAFAKYDAAQKAAQKAMKTVPKILKGAQIRIDENSRSDGVIYRARLVGLNQKQANEACKHLKAAKADCLTFKLDPVVAQGTDN